MGRVVFDQGAILGQALALRRVVAGLASSFAAGLARDLAGVPGLGPVLAFDLAAVSFAVARSALRAATLARRVAVRSATSPAGAGAGRPAGRTTSLPSILALTTASSASR